MSSNSRSPGDIPETILFLDSTVDWLCNANIFQLLEGYPIQPICKSIPIIGKILLITGCGRIMDVTNRVTERRDPSQGLYFPVTHLSFLFVVDPLYKWALKILFIN